MAAVNALSSFVASVALSNTFTPENAPDPAHLPWLMALYDAILDDDDEIRAAAASAAAPLLSYQSLVPVEASRRLLRWLSTTYGSVDEFRAYVACRMTANHVSPALTSFLSPNHEEDNNSSSNITPTTKLLQGWTSAGTQLERAMRPDDALFAVEEQNLYFDELVEACRWRDVFSSLVPNPLTSSPEVVATLKDWTLAGLEAVKRLAGANPHDGALGWTSKPDVFAICGWILTCGAALAKVGDADALEALDRFRDAAWETELHGLLCKLYEDVLGA